MGGGEPDLRQGRGGPGQVLGKSVSSGVVGVGESDVVSSDRRVEVGLPGDVGEQVEVLVHPGYQEEAVRLWRRERPDPVLLSAVTLRVSVLVLRQDRDGVLPGSQSLL